MSSDAFALWLLALFELGYFLHKIGGAAATVAKARLLEAELAEREQRRMHPPLPPAKARAT